MCRNRGDSSPSVRFFMGRRSDDLQAVVLLTEALKASSVRPRKRKYLFSDANGNSSSGLLGLLLLGHYKGDVLRAQKAAEILAGRYAVQGVAGVVGLGAGFVEELRDYYHRTSLTVEELVVILAHESPAADR